MTPHLWVVQMACRLVDADLSIEQMHQYVSDVTGSTDTNRRLLSLEEVLKIGECLSSIGSVGGFRVV